MMYKRSHSCRHSGRRGVYGLAWLPRSCNHRPPSREQLWRGVILGTLIRVVTAEPGEALSDTYDWRGSLWKLHDYNETRGCVYFTPERVVGAFFCCESEHSPFGEETIPPYDAEVFSPPHHLMCLDLREATSSRR